MAVIDENFAALDQQSTNQSLRWAFECVETLVVIARP
jgi:hypothetical protein